MKDVYKYLDDLGIKYDRHDHPPIFTVEEGREYKLENIPGVHTKNLFLRNKPGNKHYLVTIEASKKADLKELRSFLGESKLSFASPERLLEYLGLTPGSVSPLGLINNDGNVVFVLDKELSEAEIINIHPNVNTATLSVSGHNFKKFLESIENEVIIYDV